MTPTKRRFWALGVLLVIAAACGDSGNVATSPTPTKTSTPRPTPTPCTPRPAPTPTPTGTPTTTTAPPNTASPARPSEIERIPTSERIVAITIDCGGNAAGIPKILDALEGKNVPATFFFTGRWVETFADQSRQIAADYTFANHTYSHPHMTKLTDDAARQEIERAEEVIRAATGKPPIHLFRFPYGERDTRTLAIVRSLGYVSVRWTVDTLGWQGLQAGRSVDSVTQRVLDTLVPGSIVLMHAGAAPDGSTLDADALPRLVDELQRRQYRVVELARYVGG